MTERIKLTTEVFVVASGEPPHWGVHVFDVKNTKESSEQLVKQIREDQEKSEKYDACGNLINQVNELLIENESMKDKIDTDYKIILSQHQKLEKIEEFNKIHLSSPLYNKLKEILSENI